MATPRGQRRRQRIAMTAAERDDFLGVERTCRVGTVSALGQPHVSPLWFVWDGQSMWLYSIVHSQRWVDLEREPRVSVVVDAGTAYGELRGVEVVGVASPVGEIPRRGAAVPALEEPERLFAAKYLDTGMAHDGRHAWLRVTPAKLISWDFRKIGAA